MIMKVHNLKLYSYIRAVALKWSSNVWTVMFTPMSKFVYLDMLISY